METHRLDKVREIIVFSVKALYLMGVFSPQIL